MMCRAFAEPDFGPLVELDRIPAMVTLTYPGDWEVAAPHGASVKRQMMLWRKRFQRAYRGPTCCIWNAWIGSPVRPALGYRIRAFRPPGRRPRCASLGRMLSNRRIRRRVRADNLQSVSQRASFGLDILCNRHDACHRPKVVGRWAAGPVRPRSTLGIIRRGRRLEGVSHPW